MFLFIPILDQQWLKHRTRLKMSFNMILCLLIYPDQTWRPMSCPLGKKLRWVNAAGLRVPTLPWTCALPQVFLATQGSTWSTCSPGDESHLGRIQNIKANNYFPGTGVFFPHLTLRYNLTNSHSQETLELSFVVLHPGEIGCLQRPWQSVVREGGMSHTLTIMWACII